MIPMCFQGNVDDFPCVSRVKLMIPMCFQGKVDDSHVFPG